MGDLSGWIGREERVRGVLDAGLARRWLATFDLSPAMADTGAMPQGIHWCLCVPETPGARLGADGHALRDGSPGSFLPPVAAPRRMWAGSACEFLAPLAVGDEAERISRIERIEEKTGRSGPLTFVTVLHETAVRGVVAVRERQVLVYREGPSPGSPPAPPPYAGPGFEESAWHAVWRIAPGAPLLFRYSALTFNTHRIHYDADYVRDVEGYRGLVVHGPLVASLLLQLAGREFGNNSLKSFEFNGLSPAICGESLMLAMREDADVITLAAFAGDGRPVMRAQAALAGR